MNDLKPCPFCGDGDPLVTPTDSAGGYKIQCDSVNHCDALPYVRAVSLAAAIAAWNRRAPSLASIDEKLDRLLAPPQVRSVHDITVGPTEASLDMAAVWDRHRHRRREEGT